MALNSHPITIAAVRPPLSHRVLASARLIIIADMTRRHGPERLQFRPINAPRSVFRRIAAPMNTERVLRSIGDVLPQRDVIGMTSHERASSPGGGGSSHVTRAGYDDSEITTTSRTFWHASPSSCAVGGRISDDWPNNHQIVSSLCV